jgi:hypothetical protein
VGRRPAAGPVVNQKAFDGLSAEYKAIVECAAAYAHTDMQAKYDARNPVPSSNWWPNGTKLHRFPKDVMDAGLQAAMELYSELSGSNPAWKKIYDDYSAFRRDANLWFRFTEARFRRYMQASSSEVPSPGPCQRAQGPSKKKPRMRGFFFCAIPAGSFFGSSFMSSRAFIGSSSTVCRRRPEGWHAGIHARHRRRRLPRGLPCSAAPCRRRSAPPSRCRPSPAGEGDDGRHHDQLQDDEGDRALVDLRRGHRRNGLAGDPVLVVGFLAATLRR